MLELSSKRPPVCHESKFHFHHLGFDVMHLCCSHDHHLGLDVMHLCCCHDHHLGPIEMRREESSHSAESSFSHPGGIDEDITSSQLFFHVLVYFLVIFLCGCLIPHLLSPRSALFVKPIKRH